ncbi:MAG: ATP-dependent Clp protease ATP-binding subunit [Anaerolineaceae bacterium]|nr:MAG: ATP-dependent Clp protease ATP-binding subunit [Anaerolineaceae bacterium]
MATKDFPSNAEYVKTNEAEGWVYSIYDHEGREFTFFLCYSNDGYRIKLVFPDLNNLPNLYQSFIDSNGNIKTLSRPLNSKIAYSLSVLWVANPNYEEYTEEVIKWISDANSFIPDVKIIFDRVKNEILGQENSVEMLCQTAVEHIAKVAPNHPLVLVAVGPTGTGKSESVASLAKVLQEVYPELGYGFVRINLSQYKESYRVSELFGSPPGYVGYETKTNLVQALSASPKQVILWDELEKAHPLVITALLSLLDNGSLLLPAPLEDGRFYLDCRHAIFVFTTNLVWEPIYNALLVANSFGNPDIVNKVCQRHFTDAGQLPELVGRLRQFLFFRPLDEFTEKAIILQSVNKLAKEYDLEVSNCNDDVISIIYEQEREKSLGARPLQSIVNRMLSPALLVALHKRIRGYVNIYRDGDSLGITQA